MLHAVDQIDIGDIGSMPRDVQVQVQRMASAAEPEMQDQITGLRGPVLRAGVYLQLVRALAAHGRSKPLSWMMASMSRS